MGRDEEHGASSPRLGRRHHQGIRLSGRPSPKLRRPPSAQPLLRHLVETPLDVVELALQRIEILVGLSSPPAAPVAPPSPGRGGPEGQEHAHRLLEHSVLRRTCSHHEAKALVPKAFAIWLRSFSCSRTSESMEKSR